MDDVAKADRLDADKNRLEEKVKNLSKVIEVLSAQQPAPAGPATDQLGDNLKEHFEGMKKAISSLETKMKAPRPVEDKNLGALQAKLPLLDSIPALVESLKRIEEQVKKPDGQLFGGFGQAPPPSKEASLFYSELKTALEEFKGATTLKLEELERQVNLLAVKMDAKTLKNLELLAASKDEILDALVPARVRDEVDTILAALSSHLGAITTQVNTLVVETDKANNKIGLSLDLIDRIRKDIERLEARRP
ncbi:MAG: hypothetical protein HY369_02050 [Candidatus Aenigmarchaeota archaeon]|nr:hypothetical protein [Candidatus Aenigmarchaeota archaeon]